jgi:hypothetical protein
MSKPSREEIELEYNRNWFKNRVLDELKIITNPRHIKKTQSYYEKNKIHLQHLPLIYVMTRLEDLEKEITKYNKRLRGKHNFFKERKWLDEEKNKDAYTIRPLKIPNPYPN